MAAVGEECLPRVVEVRVGVPPRAHLLDWEVEDLGGKALLTWQPHARARGTPRAPPRPPRAARRSAPPSRTGAGARAPASPVPARADVDGFRAIQPKSSVAAAIAPICATACACFRARSGASVGQDVADCGRREEWADEMPAATLVLAGRLLPVLVAPDRDVLGAVVRRELAGAEREHRRCDRGERGQQLARDRSETRLTQTLDEHRRAHHRGERARALHRQLRGGKLGLDLRQQQQRLGEAGGAAQHRILNP